MSKKNLALTTTQLSEDKEDDIMNNDKNDRWYYHLVIVVFLLGGGGLFAAHGIMSIVNEFWFGALFFLSFTIACIHRALELITKTKNQFKEHMDIQVF